MIGQFPPKKITIIGSGIIGALEAYHAYLEAKKNNTKIRITIYDKNPLLSQTTATNIVPSLTPDEILSVVPRGPLLVEKLGILFSQPGGIRVDDVEDVNSSDIAKIFIDQVQKYSLDELEHNQRTKVLLDMGKASMDIWKSIYDNADPELKRIFAESNFNPCNEPKIKPNGLHDGYRIDLIYNVINAHDKVQGMKKEYESLGYAQCKVLSPKEVAELDPSLALFCQDNSVMNFCQDESNFEDQGERVWKNNACALYRPGGCLDTQIFLPKFYQYLTNVMGKYTNDEGKQKDCFRLKLGREVQKVIYDGKIKDPIINGLKFPDSIKHNKHNYKISEYIFCPGEAVGTLASLGFNEPAYSGFAGASLRFNIPVPLNKLKQFAEFNHCMEVHQEGVVLAWQARLIDNTIFIGVAGTKAFYADKKPLTTQDFSKNRNLLQFNMINDVLPECISLALGRNTRGEKLTGHDLQTLEDQKIVQRWVGTGAVAYDGFPTLGSLYCKDAKVLNARTTTHLGSGGVSFGPAAVLFSRSIWKEELKPKLIQDVIRFADTRRRL